MSDQAPFTLNKITTRYSELEDRVCLSGLVADDTVFNAWFTRRLLDRLVENLWNILSPTDQDGLSEVLNDFAQGRAEATIAPTPAVTLHPGGDCIDTLITSTDIETHPDFFRLIMRGEQSNPGMVSLTPRELRQWLSIVRRVYRQACWPTQAWPTWLIEPKPSPISAPPVS